MLTVKLPVPFFPDAVSYDSMTVHLQRNRRLVIVLVIIPALSATCAGLQYILQYTSLVNIHASNNTSESHIVGIGQFEQPSCGFCMHFGTFLDCAAE